MEGPRNMVPLPFQNVPPEFPGYNPNWPVLVVLPFAPSRMDVGTPMTIGPPHPSPPQCERVEVFAGLACPRGHGIEHQSSTVGPGHIWEKMDQMGRRMGELEAAVSRHENRNMTHLVQGHLTHLVQGQMIHLVHGQEGRLKSLEGSVVGSQEMATQTCPVRAVTPTQPTALDDDPAPDWSFQAGLTSPPSVADSACPTRPATTQGPPVGRPGEEGREAERKVGEK